MPKNTLLLTLTSEQRADVLAAYNAAPNPEDRTRYQMLLLATDHHLSTTHVAALVHRSHDVVLRVFHRYQTGGLAAVPRWKAPGRQPSVTTSWKTELVRVILDDPHDHGVAAANWTTTLLATYLQEHTGVGVNPETVRHYLHELGYVCKRPTWTVAHKAAERENWVGNACGWRSS
jgi:transposase